MQWKRLTLIVVGVLACFGIIGYLTWPANHAPHSTKSPVRSSSGRAGRAADVAGCVGSPGALVPKEFLDSKHGAAMAMVYQKQFDSAVPALRTIAAADPGYPGINLDLSDALLQSQHAQEAKSAINSQIAISDCLVQLPDHALQDYCAAELVQSDKDGCRSQLAHMQRAAHFQAALIDMALATNVEPATSTEAANRSPYPGPLPPEPPLKVAEASERPTPVAKVILPAPAAVARPAPKPPVAAPKPAPQPVSAAISAPPTRITPAAAAEPTPAPVAVSAAAKTISTDPPAPSAEVASVTTVPPPDKAMAPKQTEEPISGPLRPSEASQHVGETRTVCGPVADKHTAPTANGSPTFIELERAYPNQVFTVLVWGSDKQVVGELPTSGNVCVTGKISTYAGLPEIVLHNAKDWSVSNGPPNP
jgi:micrococcal nuclease